MRSGQLRIFVSKNLSLLGFILLASFALLAFDTPQAHAAESSDQAPVGDMVTNTVFLPIIAKNSVTSEPGLPLQFSGGPLYRVDIESDAWYLRADSHISLGSNGAEPFPFDPELDPNSIVGKEGELYALAEDGLYKRPADTMRWQQIGDIDGHFLSTGLVDLWYTPTDNPGEVWRSVNDGEWTSESVGLTGTVVSPVFLNPSFGSGYFVVTQQNGQDMLWKTNAESSTIEWQKISIIPGAPVDIKNGFFARVVDASTGLGLAVMVGGGDGKLYEYRFYNTSVPTSTVGDGWVPVWDFGAGTYPLPLVNRLGTPAVNEVAVINQSSGKITRYEGVIVEADTIPKREWREKPFPYAGLTFGAATLANGKAVQRVYSAINEPFGFAQIYLTQDGTLQGYEMDLASMGYTLTQVTDSPPRIDFSLTYSMGIDFIGALYSGAVLKWDNGICTSSENGFYRSDDKGASWQQIASDQPRQPFLAGRGNPPAVLLAMSCGGPELSTDGGISWTTPSAIHWPLPTGASHFDVRISLDPNSESLLFAAGVDHMGNSFAYSSTFDSLTNSVGEWHVITPVGLMTPTALAYVHSPFNPDMGLYLADIHTVWTSNDYGANWSSRSGGLDGATVVDFTGFANSTGEGVIAATDQGVLFAPAIGQPGDWIPAEYPYTMAPIGFDALDMLRGFVNGKETVFSLPLHLFVWK